MDIDQLFFGGGRGSGKSSWLLGSVGSHVAMYGASATCLILRRQFRDHRELIKQAKEMYVQTGLARYNASEHVLYFLGPYEGATLEFGNLERIDDYSRYHGRAFSFIGFDEITEFESWEMVEKMGSILRSKDPNVKCIMRFTGNPGGRLHQEVKRRFYDPAPKGRTVIKVKAGLNDDGTQRYIKRMMVHSTVKDNPYLWKGDPNYRAWLETLSPVLKKAWFEGCWDIAIGAFFGDVWNRKKHVISKVRPQDVPMNWEIRRAFDWGSSTPFCMLYYTISNGDPMRDGRVFPRGAIIILWEIYGQDPDGGLNKGMKLSSIQCAQMFREWEERNALRPRVLAGPADNQIYANTDGKDSNLYVNFENEGIEFTRSNKSPGSAVVGWEQIRTRLVGRDDRPLLFFSEECLNSIRTIPELARHPTKLDDIDDNQEDHSIDVVKYIALHHPIDINHHAIGEGGDFHGKTPFTDLT